MNIQRIILRNFLSHKETDFDLSKINPTIVVGANGAGKSSLVKDSITWALFGKARGTGDELITEGEGKCSVTIDFMLDANTYRVERTRERNKRTTLDLAVTYADGKGHPDNGATIAETQDKIEKLLGMTYDVFTTTACIEQGKADSFSSMTPSEAKQLLLAVLHLDSYDEYLNRVRKVLSKHKADVDVKTILLSNHQTELDRLTSTPANLDEQLIKIDDLERQQDKATQALAVLTSEFTSLLQDEQRTLREVAHLNARLSYLSDARNSLNSRRDKLTASSIVACPLCLSPITESHMEHVKESYHKEIARYEAEIKQVVTDLHTAESATKVKNDLVVQATKEEGLIRQQLANINMLLQNSREVIGYLSAEEATRKKLLAVITTLGIDITATGMEMYRLEILEKAFGKDGIPAFIVENVLPEIEVAANKILAILSEDGMSLELITQRMTKTGALADTLEMVVQTKQGSRLYDGLSGGEKFRVDLAIRIALSEVLARRNNYRCSTLIIDEGFGSLDAGGRQKFVELSNLLRDTFERLIVITHTDISDMMPNLIRVEKVDGVSRVLLNN